MRSGSWWSAKVRQTRAHLVGRVAAAERDALAAWLTPAQLALFDAMHPADRRHGLDVVATLRAEGAIEPDLLVAGLLHDAGKGPSVRLAHRIAWSLGEAFGSWVVSAVSVVPGFRAPLERLRDHAEVSAQLAAAAGCTPRTVELIRHQDRPIDPILGERLRRADEAN